MIHRYKIPKSSHLDMHADEQQQAQIAAPLRITIAQEGELLRRSNVEDPHNRDESEILFQQIIRYTRNQKATVFALGIAAVIALALHGVFNGQTLPPRGNKTSTKNYFESYQR